jgi:toxin ParE1/3/4
MIFGLLVKEDAFLDLVEAFDWYEEKQIGLGTVFLDEVEKCYERIKRSPHQFSSYNNQRIALLPRFPYKIVFEIEENTIVVYAVYHHKRDPKTLSLRK